MKKQLQKGKQKMARVAAALMAGLLVFETVPMDVLAAEPADGKKVAEVVAVTDTVSGNDGISLNRTSTEELGIDLYTAESSITTGTLGDHNGFTYSYDASTNTCTITGEDSGLLLESVCQNAEKIILQDCKIIGSMANLFKGFAYLKSVDFENCDTSQVTDMSDMFNGCGDLTELDLSQLDTSKVTNMAGMFLNCNDLTELNLSSFDTSQVTNMSSMFAGCDDLTELDLSGLDTSQVTDMYSMFGNCYSLTELDVSSFDTSQVTWMGYMFMCCESLTGLDLKNFDTSQVKNMIFMFNGCRSLEELDLSSFDTTQVSVTNFMFSGCYSLTELDLSSFDMSQVVATNHMFNNCQSLETIVAPKSLSPSQSIDLPYTFYDERATEVKKLTQEHCNQTLVLEKYDITYVLNGGTNNSENPAGYTDATGAVILASPTRTGYTFGGWYSDSAYKTKVTQIAEGSAENKTVYAQWTANKYTVKFDGNGSTGGSMSDLTDRVYDTNYSLTANQYKKKGYTFTGWNTKKDGSGTTYKNKASITNLTSVNGKTVILYAQWKANKYSVAFNGNGATSGKMSTLKNRAYGTSYKLSDNKYKKNGYTFTGWNTKKDGSGKTYKNRASVKNLSSTNKKSVTLYAQWKKNTYTIKYNLNGGTNNKKNPKSYTVTTKTITLQKPTKKGYTFKGWYSDKKCTKKVTKIKKGSTGKVTLYAKWVKK